MSRKNFGQRIHDYLAEPPGEQFVAGKWRFWLVAVVFLSVLNAILTALIFKNDDQENYISPIMLSVGALLAWLCVGCLHYSDSTDRRLARGVAGLDSITLLFVVAHFCGLMWAYGHLKTIQKAEAKYEAAATAYNAKAEKVSTDNAEIARAAREIARETTKAEKLKNDTAYQQRKAAEAGAQFPGARSAPAQGVMAPALATSAVELEKPQKPEETSAHFLGTWDWLIRVFNFGELMLAAITLVFIRNQSAKTNAPATSHPATYRDDFPDELDDVDVIEKRSPSRRQNLTTPAGKDTSVLAKKKDTAKTYMSFDFARAEDGLKRLREALKDISFRLAGVSFKTDINPSLKECRNSGLAPDHIWIRSMRANQGTQETLHSAKAKLSILDDAIRMSHDAFRAKLEKFLRENGFEI